MKAANAMGTRIVAGQFVSCEGFRELLWEQAEHPNTLNHLEVERVYVESSPTVHAEVSVLLCYRKEHFWQLAFQVCLPYGFKNLHVDRVGLHRLEGRWQIGKDGEIWDSFE